MCEWAVGFLKKNEIIEASGPALKVSSGADPEVDENTIAENASFGIHVLAGGKGRYSNNIIKMNAASGFCVEAEAQSDVRANEMCENDEAGVLVKVGANARIYGNTDRNASHFTRLTMGKGARPQRAAYTTSPITAYHGHTT